MWIVFFFELIIIERKKYSNYLYFGIEIEVRMKI